MFRLLTDEIVETLPRPRAGRKEIGDARVRGLILRLTERGVKSWSVIYKVPGEGGVSKTGRLLKGKQHRVTLGTFPLMKVEEARKEAMAILARAEKGVDPRPERRAAAVLRYGNTVKDVADRMIEDAKKTVTSWGKIDVTLRLHVIPRIGHKPISDITRADVEALLDEVKAKNTVATARETRKHLSRLFNFAHGRDLITSNPMAGMRRKDLKYVPGERVLSDDEIRAFWHATGEMGYPYGPAFRLLLLTGQRKREWLHASWKEIDAEARVLTIPAARHKSRRGHIVPLVDTVWEIVDKVPGKNGYLFLGRTGEVASGGSKVEAKLRELMLTRLRKQDPEAELPEFTIHDLRRTCETRMAQLGVTEQVCEAVLGHAKPGLRRTYNKYNFLDERRAALDTYAAHIMEVVK